MLLQTISIQQIGILREVHLLHDVFALLLLVFGCKSGVGEVLLLVGGIDLVEEHVEVGIGHEKFVSSVDEVVEELL